MRRHGFDAVSFLAGVLLIALGLIFFLPTSVSHLVTVILDLSRWALPALALLVGGVVVATTLMHRQSAGDEEGQAT